MFVDDWNMGDDLVIQIAQLLWDYENDTLTEDVFRELRKDAIPKDRKAPLDNLATWAKQGEALLAEIELNPYLIDALSP
jgi:hypothetical protein